MPWCCGRIWSGSGGTTVSGCSSYRDGSVPAHTRVIEVGGGFAGCVSLRPAEDAHWLEHFYLAPQSQGGGIGTAVLRELLERLNAEGIGWSG
ncbi:hypothetical protein STENM327S_08101 [Streptomyces tendae]